MLLRTTYGVSVSKYIEMFSGAVKEYVSLDGDGNWGDGGSDLDDDDGGSSYDDYYDRNDPGSKNAKGMFGIGHDCVIITKDNKIVRNSERMGTFIIEGDYNPTKNIKTAKIK